MAAVAAIGRIGHEDRLSLVDHLDELRARLIVCLAALALTFCLCMWQNHALLALVNRPLAQQTQKQVRAGAGPLGATYSLQRNARTVARQLQVVLGALEQPQNGVSPAVRSTLRGVGPQLSRAIAGLSKAPQGDKPVTLGIGEPFTTTVGVSLMFAFILALPVILYELYGFLVPAFGPAQQRLARPLMLAIPGLFLLGVAFVQASQYYHFAAVVMLAMGLVFQVPVGVLALTRSGLLSVRQLAKNRRYALLACGAVAAFLPGDAFTMLLETVPLYLLFELSLLIARFAERRAAPAVA
jgi:sec-independent protein translocase protein TatC